jgi:hypothetical protein
MPIRGLPKNFIIFSGYTAMLSPSSLGSEFFRDKAKALTGVSCSVAMACACCQSVGRLHCLGCRYIALSKAVVADWEYRPRRATLGMIGREG